MAVKKKAKSQPEGAPLWMVTYGDMVTLLLTFFVMLLAMSEVKKDDRFVDFMQAIREAFGYVGGMDGDPRPLCHLKDRRRQGTNGSRPIAGQCGALPRRGGGQWSVRR